MIYRLAQPPVGLEASYPPYSYPPGALALLEEQLYLERCGMLRPPLYPPLTPAYIPYTMLPTHLAIMHERMKLEEEQRQRLAREEEREKEQRERELLQQQREREQREKEKREREKAAAAAVHHTRMSPHVISPHHAIQSQMMLPMMMPSSMLHPGSLSRQSPMGLQSIQRQSPALVHPPSSFHSAVPRSSPSLQRQSPHSVFHPITSQYSSGFYPPNASQKHSPASTPSGYPPTSVHVSYASAPTTSSYQVKETVLDDKPPAHQEAMSAGEGIRDNGNLDTGA